LSAKGVLYEAVKTSYILKKTYNPDLLLPNGILVELKGLLSKENRTTLLAAREQHKNYPIVLLFRSNDKIIRSKSTYGMWCERHNIPYAIGVTIPHEWIDPTSTYKSVLELWKLNTKRWL